MLCYVICCNDGIEYVVMNDEDRAQEILIEMEKSFYVGNMHRFNNWDTYRKQIFWHIHTVNGE
jgi:hypothetical protein